PAIADELVQRGAGDAAQRALVLVGELTQEVLDEERDVVAALAQGRQRHAHDVEPVEQVFAELALLHQAAEIAVGGDEDAHVDLDGALGADAAQLALLQDAQELDLHRRWHLAHLVEEQGAAVGDLEEAAALGVGAGEGAAHVAEERGLEQRLGDGGARLGDEGLAAARTVVVDGAGDELLAGAALAVDDDGQRGIGHAIEQAEQLEHARRPANQVVVVVADGERGARGADLFVQLAELDGLLGDLLLQRAVERVDRLLCAREVGEEARVLDGDGGLLGEIADERDLGVAEGAGAQAVVGVDAADGAALDGERDGQDRAQLEIADGEGGLEAFV